MIWVADKTRQIQPMNSLRLSMTHREHTARQQDLYQREINWKIIASIISLIVFIFISIATIVATSIIFTKLRHETICLTTIQQADSTTPIALITDGTEIPPGSVPLCAANARWSSTGVTVAGLSSGLSSTSFTGLNVPRDIFVLKNGTVLVADYYNDRVMKWDRNANVGVLIAGTGSYGSWRNLLARPSSLAIRGEHLYVSDSENYRIQVFPLMTNVTSPDGTTIIGRYGQGVALNQISFVTSIVAPMRQPNLLYLSDMDNHRVLLYDFPNNNIQVVAGHSSIAGSDSTHLSNPSGLALNERINALYIADRSNNRIQKYDLSGIAPVTTVAGWGHLHAPSAIQLDPTGVHMFIADTYNHRVLLWLEGALEGHIIAGNGMAGNSMSQLSLPTQIRFDRMHNLYVADTNNSRVQRFDLISNGC